MAEATQDIDLDAVIDRLLEGEPGLLADARRQDKRLSCPARIFVSMC
jgi:hypothetical protein